MDAKRATPAWKHHELVSKAIFEALLKQDNAENLAVEHNATKKGVKTDHQIDVFWSFRMGGLEHSVIIQVKKRQEPAKKSDLLLFESVLRDIPGQPRGVFISEHGYQKGALEVARATGIAALEISEISKAPRDPVAMTNLSVMIISHRRDKSFALECEILQPIVSKLQLNLDERWMAQHQQVPLGNVPCTNGVSGVRFLDGEGNERTSMQRLSQDRIREFKEVGQTLLEVKFPDPTYMSGVALLKQDGTPIAPVEDLEIVNLIATLDITKTSATMPLFMADAATYLLRNAIEDDPSVRGSRRTT